MFDTLLYAKKLESSGLSREQAEVQIQVMTEMIVDGVATKSDIIESRHESKRDAIVLRSDLKQEMSELRQDMADLRAEVKHDLQEMKNDLTLRLGAMFAVGMSLSVAVLSWAR